MVTCMMVWMLCSCGQHAPRRPPAEKPLRAGDASSDGTDLESAALDVEGTNGDDAAEEADGHAGGDGASSDGLPPGDDQGSACSLADHPYDCGFYGGEPATDSRCAGATICGHADRFGSSYCVGMELWVHTACAIPMYCEVELQSICVSAVVPEDGCARYCPDGCVEDGPGFAFCEGD